MTSSCVRITAERAEDCAALARAVGWPDVVADWRVVFASGEVFAILQERDVLSAVGARCDFGEVAFLAKMIVRPDLQRRGLGGLILRHCLTERRAGGVTALCATNAGLPLYERHGFRSIGSIHILEGMPRRAGNPGKTRPIGGGDLEDVIALDRAATGGDRRDMIRARLAESFASVQLRDHDGALDGYAMATNQGELAMLGPVIAKSDSLATELVLALAPVHRTTRIDVDDAHLDWKASLESEGFTEAGYRTAMTLNGAAHPGCREWRRAVASQAFG